MYRWFIILALLFGSFTVHPVQAQSDVVIQSMQVDLWPEYDRPGVLVIYRITLSPTVKLPADLTIRLPKDAGKPNAVAEQTENGLITTSFEAVGSENNWNLFKFTATLPQIQVEYYDPGLKKNGTQRSFTFRWPGSYSVENLTLQIQQPAGAANMILTPNTGSASQGQDGLTYYAVPIGSVAAGTTFNMDLSYSKSNDTLTQPSGFENVTPAAATNSNTPGQITLTSALPWLLGGLGVLLISVGLLWYVRTGRQPVPAKHRRRAELPQVHEDETVYCHQCGKRAAPEDVYCRACGGKLKR